MTMYYFIYLVFSILGLAVVRENVLVLFQAYGFEDVEVVIHRKSR